MLLLLPRRSPVLSVLALVAALALLVVSGTACGIDEDVVAREAAEAVSSDPEAEPEPEPDPDQPEVASPFTLDVPDGYELVVEGRGEEEPGPRETAVTVLAPDGEAVGPEVVLVEAVRSSASEDGYDEDAAGRWSSLTVADLRAWGVEASRAELQEVLDAARAPDEPGAAPTVDDPPGDLEVVGSISVDGVVALGIELHALSDEDDDHDDDAGQAPGPTSAHVAAWRGEDATLVAVTLPAGALDPGAIVTEVRPPRRTGDEARDAVAEEVTVPGFAARGTVTTTADGETGQVVRRSLAVETDWGDVLLLITRGPDLLDAEALVEVAETVSRE